MVLFRLLHCLSQGRHGVAQRKRAAVERSPTMGSPSLSMWRRAWHVGSRRRYGYCSGRDGGVQSDAAMYREGGSVSGELVEVGAVVLELGG